MDGRWKWLRAAAADTWPGLARLWQGGLLSGLLIAAIFSILLNATLLGLLIWPAMLPQSIKLALWVVTMLAWGAGWVDGWRFRRQADLGRERDPQLDLFLSARGEYLRGHTTAAEQLLRQLLNESPEDVEARLMLATLLRHGRRLAESKEQLRRLQRWSRAAAWNLEIRHEWELLSRLECSAAWAEQGGDETAGSLMRSAGAEAA